MRCADLPGGIDCSSPKLTKLSVVNGKRGRMLRVRSSESASVTIAISKARAGGGWSKPQNVLRKARKGVNRLRLGNLTAGGNYRITARAIDSSENESVKKRLRFRVPAR